MSVSVSYPLRNTKGGKYHCTIDLLFDWFGLVCFAIITKIVCCHTANSKPVKQEVNGTVIPPPLVFLASTIVQSLQARLEPTRLEHLMGFHFPVSCLVITKGHSAVGCLYRELVLYCYAECHYDKCHYVECHCTLSNVESNEKKVIRIFPPILSRFN